MKRIIAVFVMALGLVASALIDGPDQKKQLNKQPRHADQADREDLEENRELDADNPDEAAQWRRLSWIDEKGQIPPDALMNANRQREENLAFWQSRVHPESATINPASWTSRGPQNVGGRTRSLVVHPTNPNILWAGAVSGGVWKSTNGGTTWAPLNDFLPNLAASCLTIDPANPNVLYCGTGEGFFNGDAVPGAGIFKTTDGGTSWNRIASTATWEMVNRIAIAPTNSNLILASMQVGGIRRSTDGGATWTNPQASYTSHCIQFHPTDSSKAVAEIAEGNPMLVIPHYSAVYSTDGGATWSLSTLSDIPTGYSRIELAYAKSSPNIVYASVDNTDGGKIWRSTDGGQTYTKVTSPVGTGVALYSNALWVSPTNPNLLAVGGGTLYRSTDGGASFSAIAAGGPLAQEAHVDMHFVVADPGFDGTTNKRVYVCSDGGVFRTDDILTVSGGGGWTSLNNGYQTTQYYGAAGHGGTGFIIGGTQDNATLRSFPGDLNAGLTFGGDGGFCAVDPNDDSICYGEAQGLILFRSQDHGASVQLITAGLTESGANAPFIAPFILDPNDPNRMLAGAMSVWRSNDIRLGSPPSWSAIRPPSGFFVSAIAIAQGNSNIIWVAKQNGEIYKTTNGLAATPTWITVDDNGATNPLPDRFISRLLIDPANANTVYVSLGGFTDGNLQRTTDGGTTWADVTGTGATGLPLAPIRGIARHPNNPNWLYVGTEVGIFSSLNGGQTWSAISQGPANVAVYELVFMPNSTVLLAATHGRGVWTANAIGAGTAGLYNPSASTYFLRNANSTGVADLSFAYGPAAGWIPIVGDWNGNGTDTIGLYNPTASTFFLRNANSTGVADVSFAYGPPGAGWIPLAGDWNGDGIDSIGLYNPTTGTFYLRNTNSAGVADVTFAYGPAGAGWLPIVGDWNGDGVDTIGLYNPTASTFFLRNTNSTGVADVSFAFGPAGAGWTPIVGDWNGDGVDTIGLYNPAAGAYFLRNANSTGVADVSFAYGPGGAGWLPLVGDWDGL